MNCKHENWLYVPERMRIGENTLIINSNPFLCADCGKWIGNGAYEINKIINVKKEERDICKHDLTIYILSGRNLCLRCGYEYMRTLPKLDVKTDPTWEERDKLYRKSIIDEFM